MRILLGIIGILVGPGSASSVDSFMEQVRRASTQEELDRVIDGLSRLSVDLSIDDRAVIQQQAESLRGGYRDELDRFRGESAQLAEEYSTRIRAERIQPVRMQLFHDLQRKFRSLMTEYTVATGDGGYMIQEIIGELERKYFSSLATVAHDPEYIPSRLDVVMRGIREARSETELGELAAQLGGYLADDEQY